MVVAVLSTLGVESTEAVPRHICGIQSRDADMDSSYAASMVYNSKSHRVYVTGVTHGRYFDPSAMATTANDDDTSDCFVGILQLPMRNEDVDPIWLRRVKIGEPQVSEACSDIYTVERETTRDIYLTGHSIGSPGILSSVYPGLFDGNATDAPTVYGMLLDLTWSADLKGGRLLYADAVQYPVAISADSNMADLFVASSTSAFADVDPAYEAWRNLQNASQIDSTTAGGYLPPAFGQNFAASIQKVSTVGEQGVTESDSLHETLTTVWEQQFGREAFTDGFSVQISSLLYLSEEMLVVAGSTKGADPFLGGTNTDLSLDGILTVLDPRTGALIRSKRTQSPNSSIDRILSMCRAPNTNSSEIFVVGMTENSLNSEGTDTASPMMPGSYQAFIQKVDVASLEVMWTYQLGALLTEREEGFDEFLPSLHGLACAVTPDGEKVYMAGTAKDGASISLDGTTAATLSSGKDDMFVVQLDASDGSLFWVKQIGTSENDSLANGKSLACDKDGHAILLGNTRGSFFQKKQSERVGIANDIILIMVDRATGEYMKPIDGGNASSVDTEVEVQESLDSELKLGNSSKSDGLSDSSSNSDGLSDPTTAPVLDGPGSKQDNSDMAILIALIILINVVLVSLIFLVYSRCKRIRLQKKTIAHFHPPVDGGGASAGKRSTHGDWKRVCFDGNSLWRTKGERASRGGLDDKEPEYLEETEHEHFDDERSEMSGMSGVTLCAPPKLGSPELNRDTLLRLEPASEPYISRRHRVFGQRISSFEDAYDVLYNTSHCMSTTAEGSDREEDGLLELFSESETEKDSRVV